LQKSIGKINNNEDFHPSDEIFLEKSSAIEMDAGSELSNRIGR